MKLVSAHIEAFGKLQNATFTFDQNLNIVLQDNSYGKTTLTQFIKVVLYGMKYGKNSDAKKYMPWDYSKSKKYGGHLILDIDGKQYKLQRFFGTTPKDEEVIFTELSTNKLLESDDIGYKLTGLTVDAFEQSTFIPQETVTVTSNSCFVEKLSGMLQGGDNNNFAVAEKLLLEKEKFYKHKRGNGGLINTLNDDIYILERELVSKKALLEDKSRHQAQIENIGEQQKDIEKEIQHCEIQKQELTNFIAQNQPTERYNSQREQYLNARQVVESKPHYKEIGNDINNIKILASNLEPSSSNKLFALFLTFACCLLVGAIVLFVLGIWQGGIPAIVVAIVSFVIAIICKVSGNKNKVNNINILNEIKIITIKYIAPSDDYLKDIETLQTTQREYENNLAQYNVLKNIIDEEYNSTEKEQKELQEVTNRLNRLREDKATNIATMAQLSERISYISSHDNYLELCTKLESLHQQLAVAEHEYSIVIKTQELLSLANENLSTAYLPQLNTLTSQLLSQLTNGVFSGVYVDKDFALQITENGTTASSEFFSRGIRESVAFCFRISLSKLLYKNKIPFIIIDDVFVNLDDSNFISAMKFLQTLSKDTQIIYFTCHKRAVEKN